MRVKSRGEWFNFKDGTTPEQIGELLGKYFSGETTQGNEVTPNMLTQTARKVGSALGFEPPEAETTMSGGFGEPSGKRGGLIDPLLQGASLNTADEIAGAAKGATSYLSGEGYEDAYTAERDRWRGDAAAFSERNPKTAFAAELAGGLATGGVGAARAGGSKLALYGLGAGMGAVGGAASSDSDKLISTDTAIDAGYGAGMGLVTMGLFDMASAGARGLWRAGKRRFSDTARTQQAYKDIVEDIKNSDLDLSKVNQKLKDLGDDSVIADIPTPLIKARAAAGLDRGGDLVGEVQKKAADRQSKTSSRVVQAIKNNLKNPKNFEVKRKAVLDEFKAASSIYYKRAYESDWTPNPKLRETLVDAEGKLKPSVMKGWREGIALAKEKEGVVLPKTPDLDALTLEQFDWMKKGMDEIISKAKKSGGDHKAMVLTDLKNSLLAEVDNQDYTKARSIWSGGNSELEAMDAGMELFKAGNNAEKIKNLMGGMTPTEVSLYKQGVATALRDKAANSSTDVWRELQKEDGVKDMLDAVLESQPKIKGFTKAMYREKLFKDTADMVNSKTKSGASKAINAADAGDAPQVVGGVRQDSKLWVRTSSKITEMVEGDPKKKARKLVDVLFQRGKSRDEIIAGLKGAEKQLDKQAKDVVRRAILLLTAMKGGEAASAAFSEE